MLILQKGLWSSTGTKKAIHVNSKVRLTVHDNFCSSISRKEHDRTFLSPRHNGLHSLTYIRTRRGLYGPNSTPSPWKTVAWMSLWTSSHVLPMQGGSDFRPVWRQCSGEQQASVSKVSKLRPTLWTFSCLSKLCTTAVGSILTIATTPSHIFAHAWSPFDICVCFKTRTFVHNFGAHPLVISSSSFPKISLLLETEDFPYRVGLWAQANFSAQTFKPVRKARAGQRAAP